MQSKSNRTIKTIIKTKKIDDIQARGCTGSRDSVLRRKISIDKRNKLTVLLQRYVLIGPRTHIPMAK